VAVKQSEADLLDKLLQELKGANKNLFHEVSADSEELDAEGREPRAAKYVGSAEYRELVAEEQQARKQGTAGEAASASGAEWEKEVCGLGKELAVARARPGTIVLIKDAVVRIPSYLSIYPELRYALNRRRQQNVFGAPPLSTFGPVDESLRGTPKSERKRFIKAVGPNPRIPFAISAPYSHSEVVACKRKYRKLDGIYKSKRELEMTILLPARFALLTGDPSLLSGPLTILGMVVSNNIGTFGDALTVSTFWPALATLKAPLLRDLGVSSSLLRLERHQRPLLREELFAAMAATATFHGHVVEVIPIAMYD
jgi:hypothetical protein